MTSNESKKRCGWCEDQTDLTLFSKADKKIYGFCNESCWSSFSEISFKDLCPKCNKKAKLLSVPAVNKDDLNEQFVNYCDDCFSSNFSNSDKNKKETVISKQHQNTQLKNEKSDNLIESTANLSSSSNNNSINNLNNSNNSLNSLKINHHQAPNNTSSLNNSQINQSINQPKKVRTFKNQPYEIWGCFNWDNYLKLDGSVKAPANCFAQNENPPENEFELNMKLEAPDPRNSNSTCIATVVSIMGFRIELRLDGTDNTNDFWLPVDSDKIHPIGHANNTNGMLQPPLGFRKNPSNWPVFVTQTLNNAVIAPDSCFKKPPIPPVKNLFKVGQKLEAVDRKNPRLICPATIAQVKDSMVFVSFDGWKGAFDYWVRFDSRELYPCGWCERSNHPLQMPGNKDLKIDINLLTVNYPNKIPYQTTNKLPNRSNSSKVNVNINGNGFNSNENSNDNNNNEQISTDKKIDDKAKNNNQNNNQINNDKNNNNSDKLNENPPKISDKETKLTMTAANKSESSLKTLLLDKERSESVNNDNNNTNNNNSNNNNTKINGVINKYAALINNNNNNANKLNQSTIPSINRNTSQNNLSSTSSNLNHKTIPNTNLQAPKAENNKVEVNKHPLVTVYLNIECNPGRFINLEEFKRVVKQYPESKIGPSPLNKTMRDVLQLIVDCSIDKNQVTRMIRPGNGNFAVETVINNDKIKINLPHFNRASAFWNYLNNFLGGLDCCVRLVRQSAIECKSCSNIKESQINNSKFLLNQQLIKQQQLLSKQQQLQNKQQLAIKHLTKHQQLNKLHQQPNNVISNKLPTTQKNQDTKKAVPFPAPSNHQLIPQQQQQLNNKNLKRKSSTEEDNDNSKINPIKITKITNSNSNNNNSISTTTSTTKSTPNNSTLNHSTPNLSTPNHSTPIAKTNGHVSNSNSDLEQSLSNPNDWTTDEVISFLKINDSSLDYAELFKQHEIDGKAFLLLNSDMLMKYMKIKLGPALKISSIIENLKQNQKLLN